MDNIQYCKKEISNAIIEICTYHIVVILDNRNTKKNWYDRKEWLNCFECSYSEWRQQNSIKNKLKLEQLHVKMLT
jgi:hypothetical protein